MSWLEQEGKRGGIHTGLRIISGGELEDAEYWAGCACRMEWFYEILRPHVEEARNTHMRGGMYGRKGSIGR